LSRWRGGVDVVDIAECAVGHWADELGARAAVQRPAEGGEVVRADRRARRGTNIVQAQVPHRRDGSPIRRAQDQQPQLRIGRPRRSHSIGVLVSRIHPHAAVFHVPAAVVYFAGACAGSVSELRGLHAVEGHCEGIGDAGRDPLAVALLRRSPERADDGWSGMRVGPGYEYMLRRDARALGDDCLCGIDHIAGHDDKVADDEPQRRSPVGYRDGLCMKRVNDIGCPAVVEVSTHVDSETRGDVNLCGSGCETGHDSLL